MLDYKDHGPIGNDFGVALDIYVTSPEVVLFS